MKNCFIEVFFAAGEDNLVKSAAPKEQITEVFQ